MTLGLLNDTYDIHVQVWEIEENYYYTANSFESLIS